jgi:hypothetical protein
MLKRRINKLEDVLNPKPLVIISPDQMPPSTPRTSTKVRKAAKLLNGVRLYVA